jgi:RHS repeat-associated protein
MGRLTAALMMLASLLVPRIAAAQSEEVLYYHTDAIGSVRMITDASGQAVARYDPAPFGEEPLNSSPVQDTRRFVSQEHDYETQLGYFVARQYAAITGRFTAVDPGYVAGNAFDSQSWNAYAYARNNPLRFVDPTGTDYTINPYGGTPFWFDQGFGDFSALQRYLGVQGFTTIGDSENGFILNGLGKIVAEYGFVSRSARLFGDAGIRAAPAEYFAAAAVTFIGSAIGVPIPAPLRLAVTPRLLPLKYGKAVDKFVRQMMARGWTDDMIREAVVSGRQAPAINKATGNAATRYIHPRTNQSVVIDNVTKEIIHVGGPGFRY